MSEHIYEDSGMDHERYHIIPFGSMREEIVRCKDCKHFNKLSRKHKAYACRLTCMDVPPYGFCAWGERRTNDN